MKKLMDLIYKLGIYSFFVMIAIAVVFGLADVVFGLNNEDIETIGKPLLYLFSGLGITFFGVGFILLMHNMVALLRADVFRNDLILFSIIFHILSSYIVYKKLNEGE